MRYALLTVLVFYSFIVQSQIRNDHKKTWGAYVWKGDLRSPYGHMIGVTEIKINPDLSFVRKGYCCLTSKKETEFKQLKYRESKGRITWIKGHLYAMTYYYNGRPGEDITILRINKRHMRFLAYRPGGSKRFRRGNKLKKAR